MKFSTPLFVIFVLACAVFSAVLSQAAPSVTMTPHDPFIGGGITWFKFTLKDFEDTRVEDGTNIFIALDYNPENVYDKYTIVPTGASSFTYDISGNTANCYGLDNSGRAVATLVYTSTESTSTYTIIINNLSPIDPKDAEILCPFYLQQTERIPNQLTYFNYTPPGHPENTDPVQVSWGLPESFETPQITMISAKIESIKEYEGTKVDHFNFQQLVFTFTTNAVNNIVVSLKGPLETYKDSDFDPNPAQSYFYCTTGSGKNQQIVGRLYTSGSLSTTLFSAIQQTSDQITCTIPLQQSLALRVAPFAYVRLSYAKTPYTATAAVENISVHNQVIIDDIDVEQSQLKLDFVVFAGNKESYLTPNSTIAITFKNIDVDYLRLNETYRSIGDELGNDYSWCVFGSNRVTASRKGNTVYFTDFEFSNTNIQSGFECRLYFDGAYVIDSDVGYGSYEVKVNGNKAYANNGSEHVRVPFQPTLSVEEVGTITRKLVDTTTAPATNKNDTRVNFAFRATQTDHWAYPVNTVFVQIQPDHDLPITAQSMKCQMAKPASTVYEDIELVQYLNGYAYEIPVDNKELLLDFTFKCSFEIPGLFVLDEMDKALRVSVYDVFEKTYQYAYAYTRFDVPDHPVKDEIDLPAPEVESYTCFNFNILPTDGVYTRNIVTADALADAFSNAFAQVVTEYAIPSTSSVVYTAGTNSVQYYTPFNVGSVNSISLTSQSYQLCFLTPPEDKNDFLDELPGVQIKIVRAMNTALPDLRVVISSGTSTKSYSATYKNTECGYDKATSCLAGATCVYNADCAGTYCGTDGICGGAGAYLPSDFIVYYNKYDAPYTSSAMAYTTTSLAVIMLSAVAMILF